MFFLASPYAVSSSPSGNFDFQLACLREQNVLDDEVVEETELRRERLLLRQGCAGSRARLNAFSTSSRLISRPSTTAHVSAETVTSGAAGVERHAVEKNAATSALSTTNRWRCWWLDDCVRVGMV